VLLVSLPYLIVGKASVMSVMRMWSSLCRVQVVIFKLLFSSCCFQVVVVKAITCFPKAEMIADGSDAGYVAKIIIQP
jgi:hypothetical protein